MVLTTGCKREKHYKKEYLKKNKTHNLRVNRTDNHFRKRRKIEVNSENSRIKKEKIEEVKPSTIPSANGAVYSIKPGDSLWKVSRMFHIPISYLVDYNGIEVDSPLRVGQEILIPSSLNATPPHRVKKSRKTSEKVKKTKYHRKVSLKKPKGSKYPWPLKGDVLRRFSNNFKGIDISSSKTSFVKAVSDGEVIFADNMEGYGKLVIVDNLNGMFFIYGQLRTILLNNGDSIKRGQKVGRGGTPNVSGQTRIYFEIRKAPKPGADPKAVDPLRYLK